MPSNSPTNDNLRIVGIDHRRVDSRDKITGRARYTDDLRLPGMLYAKLKRSAIAHGRITAIDTSRAVAMEGVRAVITGRDVPERYGILPVTQDETALAVDRVRYVGEPVAAVCADDEATAQRALDAIDVTYEPLANVLSIEDAFRADVRLHEARRGQCTSRDLARIRRRRGGDRRERLYA